MRRWLEWVLFDNPDRSGIGIHCAADGTVMHAQIRTTLALAATMLLGSCGGGGGGGQIVIPGPIGGACLASASGDTGIHPPPASGPYAYSPPGGWLPGTAGFPALGGTFVDPVFGTTIRRITNEPAQQSSSDIYASNGWWNANSTLFVHNTGAVGVGRVAIDVETGAQLRTNVPGGTAQVVHTFDPVDADVWYYFQNADLRQFSIATGLSSPSPIKTFNSPVERLGGSVDWIDRSGRYFLVAYSGHLHVWDKANDDVYQGEVPFQVLTGWAGISPDGNYVVTVTEDGAKRNFTSYKIDHGKRTLSTSGVLFWNMCGSHGDLVSASDGNTYLVTFECQDQKAVYRVDVTIRQDGTLDDADKNNQRSQNWMLLGLDFLDDGHFSCVSSGSNRDWCFISVESESVNPTFGNEGQWQRPYMQEVIAVQVVPPFSVKRFAHHRSRDMQVYFHQPRVSASWDGQRVAFASNFGYDANPAEYADIYVLDPSCAP